MKQPKPPRCARCRAPLIRAETGRPITYCGDACRQAAKRFRMRRVETTYRSNADLICAAGALYLRPGMTVADVTYGNGTFWRKVRLAGITLLDSDLCHADPKRRHDFRRLPYADASIDVVVLDPPYMSRVDASRCFLDWTYRNLETTPSLSHADVVALYAAGMAEAARVVRLGGQVWVKCKDEIERGRQRRTSIEVYQLGLSLGLEDQDQLVIVPTNKTVHLCRNEQRHAWKTHSYLWIFGRVS